MGLISSLAAPSAPQFQSLTVKPVARVTAALMTANHASDAAARTTARHLGGAEVPAEAALRPILATTSSEAIFRGLLPVQPALVQAATAADPDNGQIETLTEVDGISLDGIPYLRDGAVLLDDLPQAEPAPAPKAKPAEAVVMIPVAATPMRETEAQVEPEQARSDQAERAYQDEREISAVRAEPATPPTETPEPEQAKPDQPEAEAAESVDKRA